MLRILPLLIAFGLLAVSTADAAAPRNCRSGETVYKRQGVRVFSVYKNGEDFYYGCGPRTRKPVYLWGVAQAYGGLGVSGRSGDKVFFEGSGSGEGGGEWAYVGWFDARTSETRVGELVGENSNDVRDIVVAKDGSLGVLVGIDDEPGDVRVGYLERGAKRGTLQGEQALASASEGYVKHSLAFAGADRSLTWKLASGVQRTVPITGEQLSCTTGSTLAESDGARVFEVFVKRKAVLAKCAAGETTPTQLGVGSVATQTQWNVRALKRAGSRVAFLTGATGVGLLEGGQVRFVDPKGLSFVQDVAVGATGPVVFAAHLNESNTIGQKMIARLGDADAFDVIATQGGEIKPGTLAVADAGRATWMTTDGVAESTPVAGETVTDCTTGTTLHAREGLRVFELLLASDDSARLLACVPGATAPVQLLSAARTASWQVTELARENGRFAVHAFGRSGAVGNRVINFDGDDVVAGVSQSAYVEAKDVTISADGRVAAAIRSSGKWRIVGFAQGGPERTLAKPKDGVQVGSLAIDGARVVWRNASGAERSATL